MRIEVATSIKVVKFGSKLKSVFAQFGEGLGEQHRATHHLECVGALSVEDGRGIAAHALEGCEQLGDAVGVFLKVGAEG